MPPGRAPLHRVVEQVGDRPLQGVGLAVDVERVELDVEDQAVAPPPCPLDRGVDDVAEVEHLGMAGRVVAGELDQVSDQLGELLHLPGDVGEDLLAVLVGQHPGLGVGGQQLDVGAHAGERRTQLVAGVGDQPAAAAPATRPASGASC